MNFRNKKIKYASCLTLIVLLFFSCATTAIEYQIEKQDRMDRPEQKLYKYVDGENINGYFPEAVWIKTKTQTFNSVYYFLIEDGKIYCKPVDEPDAEWMLLNKTGLPYSLFEPDFEKPERIIEISADADELIAISEKGIFYHVRFEHGITILPDVWSQKQGWPEKTTLAINETIEGYRAWSLGRRNKQVLWYEDINGNQHHYGTIGISTCYFLLQDGQEIRFSDPGLPSDFSHNISGPERGRFIANSLSASASTMFLINSAGEMYTRLADFDTIGSDPMFFKYTYDRSFRDPRPGTDYGTNFSYWALPSEEWKKQPEIVTSGKAALTDCITILQNGQGNAARELRVAGLNSEGEPGYYYKQITDGSWKFREVPLRLEGCFLKKEDVSSGHGRRGESPDKDYDGAIWYNQQRVSSLNARLIGFNLLEGSCTLEVSNGEEAAEIICHPVEMWSYIKRESPGRDGTPKLFMVTLELPFDLESNNSPEFSGLLQKYFGNYDKKVFALTAEASDSYVYIKGVMEGVEPGLELFFSVNGLETINPKVVRRYSLIVEDSLVTDFYSNEFVFEKELPDVNTEDRDEINEIIGKNIKYRDMLDSQLKVLKTIDFSAGLSSQTYSRVEKFLKMTGLYQIDFPKIFTITRHSGTLLKENERSVEFFIKSRAFFYEYMIAHIENRIAKYNNLLDILDGSLPSEVTFFSEKISNYWQKIGFDVDDSNYAEDSYKTKADIATHIGADWPVSFTTGEVSFMDSFPILIVRFDDSRQDFLIEFSDFEETISVFPFPATDDNPVMFQGNLFFIEANSKKTFFKSDIIIKDGRIIIDPNDEELVIEIVPVEFT